MCDRDGYNRFVCLLLAEDISTDILEVDMQQAEPYTVVVVNHDTRKGVGFSKCCPRDKFDPELGKNIAYGRALKDLYSQVSQHV